MVPSVAPTVGLGIVFVVKVSVKAVVRFEIV
jgi:hypothetical protein